MLGAGLAIGGGLAGIPLGGAAAPTEQQIVAAPRSFRLTGNASAVTAGWGYDDAFPPPTLRVRLGDTLRVRLINRLPEHTSIHWHGIRLPNAMDGVPYLTQPPVEPGAEFVYEFRPPDAGTFWFHPHCNSIEQIGRGLMGVLVVENPDDPPVRCRHRLPLSRLACRRRRQRSRPFSTDEGAGRAGTMGSLHTVNGANQPGDRCSRRRPRPPAHPQPRQRARDHGGAAGAAGLGDRDRRQPRRSRRLRRVADGPGDAAGSGAARAGSGRGDLRAREQLRRRALDARDFSRGRSGASRVRRAKTPALPASPIPRPDLGNAETLQFTFSAASATALDPNDLPPALTELQSALGTNEPAADLLCRPQRIFWAINKRPWPGQAGGRRAAAARDPDARPQLRLRTDQRDAAHPPHPSAWAYVPGDRVRTSGRSRPTTRTPC